MCQQCSEGSIQSNGFCDICGFNELRFVEEYEFWLTTLETPAFIAEWTEWTEWCNAIDVNQLRDAA